MTTFEGTVETTVDPSREADEVVILSWVPDSQIPPQHRRAVRRMVDKAATRMGLGHIDVRYFGPPVDGGDFWGTAPGPDMVPGGVCPDDQPMTIGLHAGLSGPALEASIYHELAHIAQQPFLPADREADANRRALEYLGSD